MGTNPSDPKYFYVAYACVQVIKRSKELQTEFEGLFPESQDTKVNMKYNKENRTAVFSVTSSTPIDTEKIKSFELLFTLKSQIIFSHHTASHFKSLEATSEHKYVAHYIFSAVALHNYSVAERMSGVVEKFRETASASLALTGYHRVSDFNKNHSFVVIQSLEPIRKEAIDGIKLLLRRSRTTALLTFEHNSG